MAESNRLDSGAIAQRVARELVPGQTVALGSGWPGLVADQVPAGFGVTFLTESGLVGEFSRDLPAGPGWVDSNGRGVGMAAGGSVASAVDAAAMLRGGHVDAAIVQARKVDAQGNFVHWTTAASLDLAMPGWAVDMAAGPRHLIVMLEHTDADGESNIVSQLEGPIDGRGCVDLIVTDMGVMKVIAEGLELAETAPGVTASEVVAATEAPLRVATDVTPMRFDPPGGSAPGKVFGSGLEALRDLPDGAVVMIDGFAGPGGTPHYLLTSLRDHGAKELTIISNTAGIARVVNFGTPPGRQAIDHTILIDNGQVKKAIASYPVSPSASNPTAFEMAYRRGEVELELVPQGTLAERLRAGGAGVAAFYTPTGVGTLIAEGKETRVIDGKAYVLEQALRADFCIIRGHKADTLGNVVYKGTSRNFNSVMAPAADVTIVEVDEVVQPGELGSEEIVTPGVYVNRIVMRPRDFSPYE